MTRSPTQTADAVSATAPVVINLLSQARYLSGVREFIFSVARRFGFDEKSASHIALAVDEAVCNIIRHGYDKRADGQITVGLWPIPEDAPEGRNTEGIRIVIEDSAKQVDPDKIKGRDLADVRPGGLGVHIMKQVMNEVTYEKRAKGGMRLTMLKYLSASPTEEGDNHAD
ncbi:MAG: ATP-binding protein [Phycisphaerales bacterium]|nr:ATP-binding protein [Phycisphaerales bacterium]